jgi:hypothetical protein
VGSDDLLALNDALGANPPRQQRWNAEVATAALAAAGLEVTDVREERPPVTFRSIEEVVRQLGASPWQIRDFTPERYARELRRLDAVIRARGSFTVTAHRFLVVATRPA